jgi:hypothetical protein
MLEPERRRLAAVGGEAHAGAAARLWAKPRTTCAWGAARPTAARRRRSKRGASPRSCHRHSPYASHFPSGMGVPTLYEKNTTFIRSGDVRQVKEN